MGTIWINGNNNYVEVIFKFKPCRNANIANFASSPVSDMIPMVNCEMTMK